VRCPVAEKRALGEPSASIQAFAVWFKNGSGPSVQATEAFPFWSVVDDAAERLPPPATMPQLTFAFATGFPVAVVTDTTSGSDNTTENGPFWASPETFVIAGVLGVTGVIGDTGVESLPHATMPATKNSAATDDGRIMANLGTLTAVFFFSTA
jgi:hypothetical protein